MHHVKKRSVMNVLKALSPSRILPFDLHDKQVVIFDLSKNNPDMQNLDFADTATFTAYITAGLVKNNARIGIGKYNEDREMYHRSKLFAGKEPRTIHLGIDLWANAGTPVFAPFSAKIHSFRDNNQFGDYGATIILEHHLEGVSFYTLYGHLSRDSLTNLKEGMIIEQGACFAHLGNEKENGCWPPHLHFQIITDMGEMKGDFPGVAALSQREHFLTLCPNPNLILRVERLKNDPH